MKYKNTIIISSAVLACLLLFTFVTMRSLTDMAQENTKEINKMLTYRIYDEISSSLNEPITIAKSMSCDSFLIKQLKEERSIHEGNAVWTMQNYLANVRKTLQYDSVFVVSEGTHRYYTDIGLQKIIDPENDPYDNWYTSFVQMNAPYDLDVDVDELRHEEWTVFVNARIEAEDGTLLGVCGVGLSMKDIQALFSKTEEEYNVKINLVDENGLVQVDVNDANLENAHIDTSMLDPEVDSEYVRISDDGSTVSVTKFIEPLGWYLVVRNNTGDVNRRFGDIILLNAMICLIVALIVVTTIAVIMRRSETKSELAKNVSRQLSASADIYLSMHAINLLDDTFTEIKNNEEEAAALIGKTRTAAQQMIRKVMARFCDDSCREEVLDFVDFSTLNERLRGRNTIMLEWLSSEKKWCRSRFIVSDRANDGSATRVMYLIGDIDEEKTARDKALELIKTMNERIASVSSIYFGMIDFDLESNEMRAIISDAKDVNDMLGELIENADEEANKLVAGFAAESSRESALRFIDMSTVNERMRGVNTITDEFLSIENVWCRARLIASKRNAFGDVVRLLWLVENIDEEKKNRDRLTEAADRLTARIASIANIYMTAHEIDIPSDTFTEIRSDKEYVNDTVGKTTDHAKETLQKIMETFVDESCVADMIKFIDLSTLDARMRGKETITIEYMNRDKLWRRGRFITSKRDERGKLMRVIWLTEDINHEKEERNKLVDLSERAIAASEAKSAFLSNMSHEIRTPINAVLGMNEMILRECDDQNVIEYASSIKTAGATLLGLVNDILDFSKIEAGKMEIIPVDYDLSSVINDLVNMIQTKADEKGLKLLLDINTNLPIQLYGDEVRIKQVITNILTNAVKYTERGSVTFCIDYEKIADDPDGVILQVSVKDTGIGIKKADMQKLFSEFERIEEERNRNIEGTGLGMSITKRLLEMMDSQLEVESIYKLGSKFSFRLRQQVVKWEPIGDYEAAYKASLQFNKKYHEKFRAPDAHILVVDDTPENLVVFRSLLKKTRVMIDTADSGEEGLERMHERKYDIIFLDHMMPVKDGIETLHELRARKDDPNLETPAICLTANAISGAKAQYLAAGFDDYLSKPIDPDKLEDMLLTYLPEEKIESADDDGSSEETAAAEETDAKKWYEEISGIDAAAAMKNSGSEEALRSVMQTYYESYDARSEELRTYFDTEDWENYTIKVHALKSSSRLIGAMKLGKGAESLEMAGKDGDIEFIKANHATLMDAYRSVHEELSTIFESDRELPPIPEDVLADAYGGLSEFVQSKDYELAHMVLESVKEYSLPGGDGERFKKIQTCLSRMDWDGIRDILQETM
ncbi:MAG: response regulator [Lachnospiraceae bacterium]|nr:response regulator [Lachnospiraceae bacterium]